MVSPDIDANLAIRKLPWVPNSVQKLEPKTAVEYQYPFEYLNGDEETVRYASTTFEIV